MLPHFTSARLLVCLLAPRWLPLLMVLVLLGPAARAQRGGLPSSLAALLPAQLPASDPADIRRLWAARQQWGADSLSRLLVFARLGHDYSRLEQPDSLYHYYARAWRLATPAQRRRQPVEVVGIAKSLAIYFYSFGNYDSTLYYFRQASRLCRTIGFDSLRIMSLTLPSTERWSGGSTLAGILANQGSANRALGKLPEALRCFEQATALYQQRHDLNGQTWAQSLLGETYAEQGDGHRAVAAYEQALSTARAYQQQLPRDGSIVLGNVVLNYYAPLLLTRPGQLPHVVRLAAEVRQALLAVRTGSESQLDPEVVHMLVQVSLLSGQIALQAGQPAAAKPWLSQARHWLRYSTTVDTTAAHWHDLYYAELRANYLGLLAWQRHAADPAAARRLLGEAAILLGQGGAAYPQRQNRQRLAQFCVAMHEPNWAVRLLRPLLRTYQHSGSAWPLSQVTGLLTQAYAQAGRFDSAYYFSRRTQGLTDTLREERQYAALAATEARFRTREQASRIRLLTRLGEQRARLARLAGTGAALLALLALGLGLAWRHTRHLNRRLAAQKAQLGELDETKNQFFANVSHELRTPLTLVLGPLDSLLTDPAQSLPAGVQAAVALAHQQARRLQQLVNRLLDLTKLQAGRLALRPAPTTLAMLLRRVVAQFESLAAQRGVALLGPAPLPPDELRLLFDADKVEEILTNLLINALNHTPAGGTVQVEVALPGPVGNEYALTVRDTGPGIAPAEQARVFERYYQSPQRQAQGGTGLGLALSRELAQLLGGSLTLVSEPAQGAAFTLRFPTQVLPPAATAELAEAPATSQLADPAPAVGPRPRVLVVEDQPELRAYLRDLLAAHADVLTAGDGAAALGLLAHEAPVDLLITDAMMPQLSGTELLTHLRADPARYRVAGVPVLMLTARADETHRLQALTVGVDDYLTKPFVPAELLARVRVLLARRQVRQHFAALPPEPAPPPADTSEPPASRPVGAATVAAPAATRRRLAPAAATNQLSQWRAQVTPRLADEHFGPAELADLLCLSERTLYRRLGELAGLTPAAWLRELRLSQARQLLEAGNFGSVAAVADAVGFASPKYFATLYAERFGCRPGDYVP